jgi:Fic family protein
MQKKDRHKLIIDTLLQSAGPLSAGDFPLDVLECDRATLFRDLTELGKRGVVQQKGSTKGARYELKAGSIERLRLDLSESPDSRPKVGYNPEFLRAYEPNKTFLLSDEQLWRLCDASKVGEIKDRDAYSKVLSALLIDLSYGSSKLEDVRMSFLDTKALIEFGETPEGASPRDIQIVLNHKEAINFMVANDLSISRRDLFDLHSLLCKGLMAEPGVEGRLRTRYVTIEDSAFTPINNPHQLEEEFDLFCVKAQEIQNPFEQAFFTMATIPYLQSFQDCNKRTSRVAMNIPLVRERLCPYSFSMTPKSEYMLGLVAVYERNDTRILSEAFVKGYEATSRRYLDFMKVMDMPVASSSSSKPRMK